MAGRGLEAPQVSLGKREGVVTRHFFTAML